MSEDEDLDELELDDGLAAFELKMMTDLSFMLIYFLRVILYLILYLFVSFLPLFPFFYLGLLYLTMLATTIRIYYCSYHD